MSFKLTSMLFFLEAPEKSNSINLFPLANSHLLDNIIYLINTLNHEELCKLLTGK